MTVYAYVDETGNTGNRIFDPEQPLFITAAMMTKTNFDAIRKGDLADIAKKVGVQALHANKLGVAKIELIADDLLKLVKAAKARFYLSRVEKRYLAATKMIDTYFDSGENLAVPWHIYNLRHLRLILAFKIAHDVLTEEVAQTVWDCLTERKEDTSLTLFKKGAEAILANLGRIPDRRFRQTAAEAMRWAIDNPENFSFHTKDRAFRYSHSPNFVAFTALIDGIDAMSKKWQLPVRELVHDRQYDMETLMRFHHQIVANASDEVVHWPGEKLLSMRRVPGSALRIATEETSPGLQVIDVVLWLFKRVITAQDIGPNGAALLHQVYRSAWQNDFSFDGVSRHLNAAMKTVMSAPWGEDKKAFSQDLRAKVEQNRQAAMEEYATSKNARIEG